MAASLRGAGLDLPAEILAGFRGAGLNILGGSLAGFLRGGPRRWPGCPGGGPVEADRTGRRARPRAWLILSWPRRLLSRVWDEEGLGHRQELLVGRERVDTRPAAA